MNAVVVVSARDQAGSIGACLRALARQTVTRGAFETIVVLGARQDGTAEVVERSAAGLGLRMSTVVAPGAGAGAARRAGMDAACRRLLDSGSPDGLIACIDAESRPAPDWLERQLAHLGAGARAVAGHHAAGASMGVTAATYARVGATEPPGTLEDDGLAGRLARHGIPILSASDVRVLGSAHDGRGARGVSVELAVSRWSARRRYRATDFAVGGLRDAKGDTTVTVIVPTKECGATIGGVLGEAVAPLVAERLVDEVVVVDAGSADGTARAVAVAGVELRQQDELRRDLGPALGKGDAMWRALQATDGEIVCFLDGDTADPRPEHLLGLLGPLLSDPAVALVKGAFDRPLWTGGVSLPNEGGRVTELMARPLINLHEPLLAGFTQPLAGEFAGRRALLESIPFPVGYGVEIAVLIDALRSVGLDALAECHLGSRQNRHQPLRALGEMAYAVLAAVELRLPGRSARAEGRYLKPWEDGTAVEVPVDERPPVAAERAGARRRLPAPVS